MYFMCSYKTCDTPHQDWAFSFMAPRKFTVIKISTNNAQVHVAALLVIVSFCDICATGVNLFNWRQLSVPLYLA